MDMRTADRAGGSLAALPIVALILAVTPALHAADSLSVSESAPDGKRLIALENQFLKLVFDPAEGGIATQCIDKLNGHDITDAKKHRGLFKDHWANYAWPSALMWLPYRAAVHPPKGGRAGVTLSLTVPKNGGGKGGSSKMAPANKARTPANLVGLVINKTVWLEESRNVITVDHELHNPTGESRSAAIYLQHQATFGGSRTNDAWYLPDTDGIHGIIQLGEGLGSIGKNWVNSPTGGWMAVRDDKTDLGMAFVFDYNYLDRIYTCGSTAEWFYENVSIAPGASFKTTYYLKPANGFKGFVHASENIVADIEPDEKDGAIEIAFDLLATRGPLSDISLDVAVTNWITKKVLAKSRVAFGTVLPSTKRRKTISVARPDRLSDGMLISVRASSDGFADEAYEYFYAGDEAEYTRRYKFGRFGAGDAAALAGGGGDSYRRAQPRKRKVYQKPDFSTMETPSARQSGPYKVFVLYGLYTRVLRLNKALAGWTKNGGAAEFAWSSASPKGAKFFPGTYEELFGHQLLVLANVNYKTIGDDGFEKVYDYAKNGGTVFVTGGPYAYGNAEAEDTRLTEMLPVELRGPFDHKWAGKGKAWDLRVERPGHPLVEGVDLSDEPQVMWLHKTTLKRGATEVLSANGMPALVVWKLGEGYVVASLLSPCGVAPQGKTAWWKWKGWDQIVRNVAEYRGE